MPDTVKQPSNQGLVLLLVLLISLILGGYFVVEKPAEDRLADLEKQTALAKEKQAEAEAARAQSEKERSQAQAVKEKAQAVKAQADADSAQAEKERLQAKAAKAKAEAASAEAEADRLQAEAAKAKADAALAQLVAQAEAIKAKDTAIAAQLVNARLQAEADKAKAEAASAQAETERLQAEAANAENPSKLDLKTDDDKISYFIGNFTERFAHLEENIDQMKARKLASPNVNLIVAGFRDRLNGKPQMTDDELNGVRLLLQLRQADLAPTPDPAAAVAAQKAGQAFLDANKVKEGVIVTKSGLQYKIIKNGAGTINPVDTDKVSVNYRGTFVNGTEFDSSQKNGGPVTLGVNQVIPGWTEGLKLMKEGDKFQFFIPSELAYGSNAKGPIGPNSTLIFEVELLKINPK